MTAIHAGARLSLTCLLTLALGRPAIATAQGIGATVAIGTYGSLATAPGSQRPGLGGELAGHWTFPSGFALGLGGRYLIYPRGDDRATVFLDGRYAPATSPDRRTRPVLGLRLGPYYGGGRGDGDGSPLFGIETGAVFGVAVRAGPGASVAVLGDLGVVLSRNDTRGNSRRVYPGLQVGLVLH